MKEVILAESAGFCFGVNRAVELAYELLGKNEKVSTLGPIIHNQQVIDDMAEKGAKIIDTPDEAESDSTIIIRTHGIPCSLMNEIEVSGNKFLDATCPFVKKIHKIVSENSSEDIPVLIAGDEKHPEVVGIKSYSKGETYIFNSSDELVDLLKNKHKLCQKRIIIVAQTTFSAKEWKICKKNINLLCTNAKIFDTICSATHKRQSEAVTLSLECDAMLIVGGRHSSNTQKLKSTCEGNCPTFLIETADELEGIDLSEFDKIGITAGASTPASIIKEVHNHVRNCKRTD